MSGSIYGTLFQIATWGESHGKGIGVTIDGCPAGLPLKEATIQKYLDRRKPGQTKYSTPRKEKDQVEIFSGVFEGMTTGAPIAMAVLNETQRSSDYTEIASCYRPGHADYCFDQKFGFRDYRGGGRSSGRETIGRVAAGAVACEILKSLGIEIYAYTRSIGPVTIKQEPVQLENIMKSPLYMPDLEASAKAETFLLQQMEAHNSAGGIIECVIKHMPTGIGEPVFQKLDANLAKAVMSIGAVKGVEIGSGFHAAHLCGTENNDNWQYGEDGALHKLSNHSGGILGGISDGSDILLRAAIKPTPSVFSPQKTINQKGENIEIRIKGRHDPVIVPRAVVVVESMAALTIVDMLFQSMTSRLDGIKEFFRIRK